MLNQHLRIRAPRGFTLVELFFRRDCRSRAAVRRCFAAQCKFRARGADNICHASNNLKQIGLAHSQLSFGVSESLPDASEFIRDDRNELQRVGASTWPRALAFAYLANQDAIVSDAGLTTVWTNLDLRGWAFSWDATGILFGRPIPPVYPLHLGNSSYSGGYGTRMAVGQTAAIDMRLPKHGAGITFRGIVLQR